MIKGPSEAADLAAPAPAAALFRGLSEALSGVAVGAGQGDAQDKPRADRATPISRHEETTR